MHIERKILNKILANKIHQNTKIYYMIKKSLFQGCKAGSELEKLINVNYHINRT